MMSYMFQSLTRDSNHSNLDEWDKSPEHCEFQSLTRDSNHSNEPGYSPAVFIGPVSIPHAG